MLAICLDSYTTLITQARVVYLANRPFFVFWSLLRFEDTATTHQQQVRGNFVHQNEKKSPSVFFVFARI